jgi:hypothetical protein
MMHNHKDFLAPKLTGPRFDDHSIPLDLLEDFAAFEELLIEMAKVVFLEQNRNRQRVPRGFTDSVSLKLYGVGEGSAIPKIALIYAMTTTQVASPEIELFPETNYTYFEEARDRIFQGIEAANSGGNIKEFIPESLLGYFNKIGKRLKEDEAINFNPASSTNTKLDRSTRKKLVLASSLIKQVTEEITLIALIPEVDKSKRTFTLMLDGAQRITVEIPPSHISIILKAFDEYEKKCRVSIKGIGRFNEQDKLEGFELIEGISIIDPLDVFLRLEEISTIKNGWLNGEGLAPSKENLNWFATMFEGHFNMNFPLPYIFPTPSGGIQAEWTIHNVEISLTVNLDSKVSLYHQLNHNDDLELSDEIALDEPESWEKLNSYLNAVVSING